MNRSDANRIGGQAIAPRAGGWILFACLAIAWLRPSASLAQGLPSPNGGAHTAAAKTPLTDDTEPAPRDEQESRKAEQAREQKRNDRIRVGQKIAITVGTLALGATFLSLSAVYRDNDWLRASSVAASVVGGGLLGFDIGVLAVVASGGTKQALINGLIVGLIAVPILAIGGGIGAYYATSAPGWSRFGFLAGATAIATPHVLYWTWTW